MSDFTIESNVPPPSDGDKFPFAAMQVGDSFLVPHEWVAAARGAAATWARHHEGFKYTSKKVEGGHYRIWRIA